MLAVLIKYRNNTGYLYGQTPISKEKHGNISQLPKSDPMPPDKPTAFQVRNLQPNESN
jgi:hypothetical protein